MAKLRYVVILLAIFLVGCLGSDQEDVCISDEDTAKLTKTEEMALGVQTFKFIEAVELTPRGFIGSYESIEPYNGSFYIINLNFGGAGMPQTPLQALVSSDGRLYTIGDLAKFPNVEEMPPAPAPTEAPEQLRVEVSIDDDYCLGSEDAPVTIIEFSDYQCSYCQRFWDQTLPQIKSEYIETGKVKFVYRDFPLGGHANAQKAAEATECAGDQGKFWEMHDKVFGGMGEWSGSGDPAVIFKNYASELELNETEFADCLDSGKYTGEVQKDLQDGAMAGVQGTPAFFVDGIFVEGAQPFSTFKRIIDSELATNGSASTITGTCTGK